MARRRRKNVPAWVAPVIVVGIFTVGGAIAGAAIYERRQKKKAKPDEAKLTPKQPPRPVYGLRIVPESACSLVVIDDGDLFSQLDDRSLTLYGSLVPPEGKTEELWVSVLETAFPSCRWPPPSESWYLEEEGERVNWPALMALQAANNREWREEPQA